MKAWYDGEKQYKYTDVKLSTMCGHFTQIAWSDSELLGVGWCSCATNPLMPCAMAIRLETLESSISRMFCPRRGPTKNKLLQN
uniref:SCP domain-containing protein n=1 Tax=Glossina morsitans morsitans TaxID=37546 RepID=A0A1B0GDK1_GLOMM